MNPPITAPVCIADWAVWRSAGTALRVGSTSHVTSLAGPRKALTGAKAWELGRCERVSCQPVRGPSARRVGGLCVGEPLPADEEIPGFDAGGHDLLRKLPRVVSEAAADVRFGWHVCDQQDADAPMFAADKRPGEQDDA